MVLDVLSWRVVEKIANSGLRNKINSHMILYIERRVERLEPKGESLTEIWKSEEKSDVEVDMYIFVCVSVSAGVMSYTYQVSRSSANTIY